MKILITEQQLNVIKETIDIHQDNDDINSLVKKTKDQMSWMDYRGPEIKHLSSSTITDALKTTIDYYNNNYHLKRVVVKDDNEDVGFLVYSKTTEKKEGISDDTEVLDILLSTAINPNYRQRGLLKMMIEKSGIVKPFITHVSSITTPKVWEKIGCKTVRDLGHNNRVLKCI